jgi:hypothetical protein
MSEDRIFDIEFDCEGKHYKGWVNPSDELQEDGLPVSSHVVLQNVSFGYLSYNNGTWSANQERPAVLVQVIGDQIVSKYKVIQQ